MCRSSFASGSESTGSHRAQRALHLLFLSVVAFLVASFAVQDAVAQSSRRIQGVVQETSGVALPSATVKIENLLTQQSHSLEADQRGGFSLSSLAPGRYSVSVESPGFATVTKTFELSTGQIAGASLTVHLARSNSVSEHAGGIEIRPANPIQLVSSNSTGAVRPNVTAKPQAMRANAATAGSNPAADFNIYSPVIAPNPLGFGFNEAYNDGSTNNSWVLTNGGGSPYDTRLPISATDDGTDTTLISTDAGGPGTDFYQSIISGFFVGATSYTYRFQNNAWSLLRKDTVSGYTAVPGSTNPADFTVTFASSGPATKKGDVIWLDLDGQPNPPFQDYYYRNSNYAHVYPYWNTEQENGYPIDPTPSTTAPAPFPYTLVPDVPTAAGGPTTQYSVQLSDSNTELQGLTNYLGPSYYCGDGGFGQGHTYEVGVWLKQSGIGDASVTFSLLFLNVSHTFTGVTNNWQYFTYDFPAPPCNPSGTPYPAVRLDFNAPGTMWENGLHVSDTASAPYTLDNRILQAWTDYKPSTMRIWSNFAGSSGGYAFWSLDSWLEPENRIRVAAEIGNYYVQSEDALHLPTALQTAKQIGANPWLIVSMSLSAEEWGDLVDYLSAPAGTPGYASKRPADHPGPYTDDFSTIYLEVGNEEWGTQETPLNFAYGQWVHYVASSSTSGKSYANLNQLKFVTNSFFLQPSFGSAAVSQAPESTVVDYALYNGGDQTLTGDSYYQSDLVQLPATNQALIDAMVAQQKVDAGNGHPYTLAAYESGPGQDTPVHQGDPTLAAATATMDVDLYASLRGFGPINQFLFALGTGPYSSHSDFTNGFFPHPVWEAMQMRNTYLNGDMVWTVGNTVPTVLAPDGRNYPAISVYGFHDNSTGNNQADVVVISRDLNNTTPVTLHFPGTPTGSGNLYTLTGDPRSDNNTALNIPIGTQTLSGVTKDYTFSMPPGSIYIFQVPIAGSWSTQIPAPAAPQSVSAVSDNGKVQLTWATVDGSSTYHVKRATVSGGPYTTVASPTGPGYTDSTVTNGVTYYYVVSAANVGGESPNSSEVIGAPNVAVSPLASAQPPLDGSDTGAWVSVPSQPLLHDFNTYTPDTASYKTLWDNNYLYILATVQDTTPAISTGPYAAFNGDSVEVYFSGTDNKSNSYGPTDFQYAFPYGTSAVLESKHNALAGIIFNQHDIPGGYQFAIAIPWTTLGTTPVAGKQYGLDVMINDATSPNNRIGKLAWWGTRDFTYSDPSLMGPLVLSPNGTLPATTTALSISPSGALTVDEPVSLIAKVAVASGTVVPTGKVTFSITGPSAKTVSVKLDAHGGATTTLSLAKSGRYSISAAYTGSTTFAASASSALAEAVAGLTTGTLLSLSPGSNLVYGHPWTISATVTAPSGQIVSGGTVVFTIGTKTKSVAVDSTGTATYTTTAPAPGTYSVTAAYGGTSTFAASTSAPISVSVAPTPTATTFTINPSTGLAYGAPWTLTASVKSSYGTPSGHVTFNVVGPNSQSAVVSVDKTGTATYVGTAPRDGTYSVTATYGGATDFASSISAASSVTIVGTVAQDKVTLTQTPATGLVAGKPWSLTALVTPVSVKTIPTGTVTFKWTGGTSTVALDSTGKAVYNGVVPPVGPQSVVASYSGSSAFHPNNSNALQFTVLGSPTTTSLAVTPTGGLVTGQSLTLSAQVLPVSGTAVPTGSVSFTFGSITASVPLDSTGKATYTTSAPAPGSYAASASYSGSSTLAASVSASLSETVTTIPTATSIAAAPAGQVISGSTLTLTAVVSPGSGTAIPIGTVAFTIGSTTTSVALDATGKAVYTGTAPAPGTYSASAAYSGSTTFSSSVSPTLSETVVGAPTTTLLSITPGGTLTAGQPVTYVASVTANSGTATPSGSVTFSIGGATQSVALNSSGVASLASTAPSAGSYAVTASYVATGNFANSVSTAAGISVVALGTPIPIAVPDHSFEADVASYNVPQGWNFTSTANDNSFVLQQICNYAIPGVDGTNFWCPGAINSGPTSSSTGTLTTAALLGPYAANTAYTLTVALADPADGVDPSNKQFGLQLLANGVVVASYAPANIVPGAGFTDYSVNLYTSSHPEVVGQNITVALVYGYAGNNIKQGYFDNVRLSQSYGVADPGIPTTTTLAVSPGTTVTTGSAYTLTATVAPSSGTAVPSGSVLFTIGSTIQTVALDGTGTAVYNGTAPAVGTYNLTAVYSGLSGTTSFASSTSASTTLTVTPLTSVAAINGLTVTGGDGLATLAWPAASNAISYNVYQGSAAGAENSTPVQTGITGTTATITGLTDGSTYYFIVRGVNGALLAGPSNEVSVTPAVPPAGNPPLAYEPFDTPAGALQGVSDGTGWADSWSEQTGAPRFLATISRIPARSRTRDWRLPATTLSAAIAMRSRAAALISPAAEPLRPTSTMG